MMCSKRQTLDMNIKYRIKTQKDRKKVCKGEGR